MKIMVFWWNMRLLRGQSTAAEGRLHVTTLQPCRFSEVSVWGFSEQPILIKDSDLNMQSLRQLACAYSFPKITLYCWIYSRVKFRWKYMKAWILDFFVYIFIFALYIFSDCFGRQPKVLEVVRVVGSLPRKRKHSRVCP